MLSTSVNGYKNNLNNISFLGNETKYVKGAAKKTFEMAQHSALYKDIAKQFEHAEKIAKGELEQRIKNSTIESKIDGLLEKYFTGFLKFGKKIISGDGKNGAPIDAAKLVEKVTSLVLWGNVFKEIGGTALYTTQALTNEDLPKEKRKFVGMYDLFVGIVSTGVSFLFGKGLQTTIKNGYVKAFKPAASLPKTAVIASSAAAFTSFALQTIVGKRIVAPAIATPWAGKVKEKMMAKEEAKKAGNMQVQPSEVKKEDVKQQKPAPAIATELPLNKDGYVDLKTYLDILKEQQRQAE